MESEHWVGKVAQKAIIEKDGKVLLVRDSRGPSMWEIPGGRLHRDEVPSEGLRRELQEELGVDTEIGPVIYSELFTQSSTNEPHILIAYTAKLKNPAQIFSVDPIEIAEMRWITAQELNEKEMYPNCYRAVLAYFAQK